MPFLALVIALNVSGAPESRTSAPRITLETIWQRVLRTHPFITSQSLQPRIEAAVGDGLSGPTDWRLNASGTYQYLEPVVNSPFVAQRQHSVGGEVSLERRFFATGGTLSASLSTNYSTQTFGLLPGGIMPGATDFTQNRIGLVYAQPLWRNIGGKVDKLARDLQAYNTRASQLSTVERQEEFLLDLGLRFIDWAYLHEDERILQQRKALAETQLAWVERKRRANLVDRVDVLRGRDEVRLAEQNLVLAQSRTQAARAELSALAQQPELTTVRPQLALYATRKIPAVDEVWPTLRDKTRSIEALRESLRLLEHQRNTQDNARRPDLSARIGAALADGAAAAGDAYDMNRPDIFATLVFSHPLGATQGDAAWRETALRHQALEADLHDTQLQLRAALESLTIQIQELERVLQLHQAQIASAHARTKEEERLYRQGRGLLTFVIQSRDGEQIARQAYANSARLYQQLHLRWLALNDRLLAERHGQSMLHPDLVGQP